jgi:hypothetical protein
MGVIVHLVGPHTTVKCVAKNHKKRKVIEYEPPGHRFSAPGSITSTNIGIYRK